MKKEKPVGVSVFSITQLIFSILTILIKVISIIAIIFIIWAPNVQKPVLIKGLYVIIYGLVFLILVGILGLTASIGTLKGKKWGRKMLILVAIIAIILGPADPILGTIISLKANNQTSIPDNEIFSLILTSLWAITKCAYYISLIVYFNTKKVKEYYQGESI